MREPMLEAYQISILRNCISVSVRVTPLTTRMAASALRSRSSAAVVRSHIGVVRGNYAGRVGKGKGSDGKRIDREKKEGTACRALRENADGIMCLLARRRDSVPARA